MSYKIQDTIIINDQTAYVDLAGTTAVKVPSGNTAQQPTGVAGQLRFNSDNNAFEGYNGTAWGSIAPTANYQAFTSSGTWTKPPGVTLVYVEIWGAGASGGATVSGAGRSAFGGGGGGFLASVLRASDLAATVNVTIGSGGAAVVRSVDGSSGGNAGGNSSFGTLEARGGGLITLTTSNLHYIGGNGEINTGSISGAGGDAGASGTTTTLGYSSTFGGAGGGAIFESTARAGGTSKYGGDGGAASATTGVAGSAPGGGGGACARTSGSTATSGAGARGEVRAWSW